MNEDVSTLEKIMNDTPSSEPNCVVEVMAFEESKKEEGLFAFTMLIWRVPPNGISSSRWGKLIVVNQLGYSR